MYYQPLCADGSAARLPWQCRFVLAKIAWPLRDNPTQRIIVLNFIVVSIGLSSYLVGYEAALNFLISNSGDIKIATEAIATMVIYNDISLRIFGTAIRKPSFKKLFKIFYQQIHVDQKEDAIINKAVQRSIIPIDIYSIIHLTAITTFCLGPIVTAILYDSRLLPHPMEFRYELEDPLVYGLILFQLTCNGLFGTAFLNSELSLLGNCVQHLCARYEILQNNLKASATLMSAAIPCEVAREFRIILNDCIKQNWELNKFAKLLNKTYTFNIFTMIAHSTTMLCVLIFQVSTSEFGSAKFLAYAAWMTAKILELVIYGGLGTKLITTTNNLSSMYYHCNWETIVYRSTNKKQNVLLMKQISLAILLYREPIELNGFGFFNVSLETAASVSDYAANALIRGAGSYFTFLTTFT